MHSHFVLSICHQDGIHLGNGDVDHPFVISMVVFPVATLCHPQCHHVHPSASTSRMRCRQTMTNAGPATPGTARLALRSNGCSNQSADVDLHCHLHGSAQTQRQNLTIVGGTTSLSWGTTVLLLPQLGQHGPRLLMCGTSWSSPVVGLPPVVSSWRHQKATSFGPVHLTETPHQCWLAGWLAWPPG